MKICMTRKTLKELSIIGLIFLDNLAFLHSCHIYHLNVFLSMYLYIFYTIFLWVACLWVMWGMWVMWVMWVMLVMSRPRLALSYRLLSGVSNQSPPLTLYIYTIYNYIDILYIYTFNILYWNIWYIKSMI